MKIIRNILIKFKYKNLINKIPIITDLGKEESFKFIKENRRNFAIIYGYDFFNIVLLNHRSHFCANKKKTVMKRYKKYIINNSNKYKSFLAISLNILRNFDLNKQEKDMIYNYIKHYVPKEYHNSNKLLRFKGEEMIKVKR